MPCLGLEQRQRDYHPDPVERTDPQRPYVCSFIPRADLPVPHTVLITRDIIYTGGTHPYHIFSFDGPPGIGKTKLLNELYYRVKLRSEGEEGYTSLVALIDLAEERYSDPNRGPVALLEEVVEQIEKSNEKKLIFSSSRQGITASGESAEATEETLRLFFLDLSSIAYQHSTPNIMNPQRQPLVLFLDNIDRADPQVLSLCEEKLIQPLVTTRLPHTLVVTSGRKFWQPKIARLRQIQLNQEIDPFNLESTKNHLPERYKSLAEAFYQITFGHPAANQWLALKVHEIEEKQSYPVTAKQLEQLQSQLIKELTTWLVEGILLPEAPFMVKGIVRPLSIFRQFDIQTLKTLLSQGLSQQEELLAQKGHYSLLQKMLASSLVQEWNTDLRRNQVFVKRPNFSHFSMSPVLRRILNLDMQLNNPRLYRILHRTAFDSYSGKIETEPGYNPYYRELLYHRAELLRLNQVTSEKIREVITAHLEQYSEIDEELTDYLLKQFELDAELSWVTPEWIEEMKEKFPAGS